MHAYQIHIKGRESSSNKRAFNWIDFDAFVAVSLSPLSLLSLPNRKLSMIDCIVKCKADLTKWWRVVWWRQQEKAAHNELSFSCKICIMWKMCLHKSSYVSSVIDSVEMFRCQNFVEKKEYDERQILQHQGIHLCCTIARYICASHLTDLFRLWMNCKVERLIDAYVPCEPCLYARDTCMCKHSDVRDWWFHTKRFAETEINLSRATFITHSSCLWWGGCSFCSNLNKIRLMLTKKPDMMKFHSPC